ncbi:universal stress protein, partial [Burkholderia pseudomallei]|uniref:universal stress protein n=1 Tax=Burkholderia pseudomallei TaxID=28450 RepID=UPI0005723B45
MRRCGGAACVVRRPSARLILVNGGPCAARETLGRACAHAIERCFPEVSTMYKKIFAALDGGRSASVALDEAIKIAETFDATVTAVCVVEHKPRLVDVD